MRNDDGTFSRGNKIDEAQNIAVIESLLDRIVGKTLKIEGDIVERVPLIERLHTISPESLEAQIDELIRNREIIKKEYASIEK